jgi:hypothetical protein
MAINIRNRMTRSEYQIATNRWLLLLLVVALCVPHGVRATPSLCVGSMEFGYSSIAAINADILAELQKIQNGATPSASYTFNLCSNTVFDASTEPLRPALSNSLFVCGTNGKSSNNCRIENGAVQVEISDSVVANYTLGEITFLGVQFTGFTKQAVSAYASFPTQANFRDVLWTVSSKGCLDGLMIERC